jgi:spore coat protein U-like protein
MADCARCGSIRVAVRTYFVIACIVAAALAPGRAHGARCNVSTSGLAFGSYDPFSSAPVNSSGSLSIGCTYGHGERQFVLAYVTLGGGSSGNPAARRMTGGPERLSYNIYRDARHERIWGDGNGYSGAWIWLPTTASMPFYGSIPAGQDVAVGDYADSITVTVHFY